MQHQTCCSKADSTRIIRTKKHLQIIATAVRSVHVCGSDRFYPGETLHVAPGLDHKQPQKTRTAVRNTQVGVYDMLLDSCICLLSAMFLSQLIEAEQSKVQRSRGITYHRQRRTAQLDANAL